MPHRPNIVIYCTDQQRADLLGCAGHPQIQTPNIDALASRGTRLNHLHIQATVCMPSRASILTGQYPSVHGVTENGFDLSHDRPTIAHMLSEAGYFTACVGRTHVSCSQPNPTLPARGYHGFERGIHSQCYWNKLDPYGEYVQWIRREHPEWFEAICGQPVNRDDALCASWASFPEELSMTSWVTDRSLDVVRDHQQSDDNRPLMLWAGVWDPHYRFLTPSPWQDMYPPEDIPLPPMWDGNNQLPEHLDFSVWGPPKDPNIPRERAIQNSLSLYWGMISHVDDQFGRLMRGLDEMGQLDNTIVLFISDHGEMAGEQGLWGKQACFFEATNRVPGIAAGPHIASGRTTAALAETVDLAPTLAEWAGLAPPAHLSGRSLAKLLSGETDSHREDIFAEHHDLNGNGEQMLMLRTGRHKIVHYVNQPHGLLYDLEHDPHETHNLWDSAHHQAIKQNLRHRLLDRYASNLARPDTRTSQW